MLANPSPWDLDKVRLLLLLSSATPSPLPARDWSKGEVDRIRLSDKKKKEEEILRTTEMDVFDAMIGSAEEKPKL